MRVKEDDFVTEAKREYASKQRKNAKPKEYGERLVAKWLVKCVEESGGFITKMHPLTAKGIPDYLVITHGRTIFVETKTTGKTCEPAQIEFHKRLKTKGIDTYVLDTKITNFYDLYKVAYKTY